LAPEAVLVAEIKITIFNAKITFFSVWTAIYIYILEKLILSCDLVVLF
jgi:hypothetical protein